ncbi:MAG: M14/M99 family metallopeptidase [Desulfovibrio sp.]
MKRTLSLAWISLCLLLWAATAAGAAPERYVFTFFEGTQYPLTVVFLHGEQSGPTIMVQGGIQGDEPSGYITAQILSRSEIRTGNLIVVPRANVPSINLRQRQVNVDMNRRFDQDYNLFYEDRLARVVRFLLARSDALIHLHEGSGFYHPTYVDSLRNPLRYGQSIIVDALVYRNWDLGRTVDDVLAKLNPKISPESYRFQLFNTRTFDDGTNYSEMRKSLTCYALTALNIPAMAVEVSKNITQLDWKVKRQLEATEALLRHYGVDVVVPEVNADMIADYADDVRVRINGKPLAPGQIIDIAPGAPLTVETDDESNALSPAISVFASDRPGVNLINTPRLALDSFKGLEVRSDGKKVASAQVRLQGNLSGGEAARSPVFVCWLNGRPHFVREGQTLGVLVGDQLILEGIWGSTRDEILNFKGYVAQRYSNDGQDCGWEIILDPDNFIDKYRLDEDDITPRDTAEEALAHWAGRSVGRSEAARFRVVRETPGQARTEFYIAVRPRTVHALRLLDAQGESVLVPWQPGGEFRLPEGSYVLEDAWSNGPANKLLTTANDMPVRSGASVHISREATLRLCLRQATTFASMGSMNLTARGPLSDPVSVQAQLPADSPSAPMNGEAASQSLAAGTQNPEQHATR